MNKKKILLFCAHPDDAELCAGGTIIKFINKGFDVKIIVMTNGNVGNNGVDIDKTSNIRRKEMNNASKFMKCDIKCLDINDGEIMPCLKYRKLIIDEIRDYKPDIIMTHRENDYHPDHRYTSILVQDSLVLICSENYNPKLPALNYTPITLFFWNRFTKPTPFSFDIVCDVSKTFNDKIKALSIHQSQFKNYDECKLVLDDINNDLKKCFNVDYKYIEAFEICEYAKKEELSSFISEKEEIFK